MHRSSPATTICELFELMTREQRRISPRDRVLGNAAGVIAEGDVHEDSSAGGVEAHHESFGVLAAFGAVVRGVHVRR